MGSLGEEELVRMVRDFIESETPTSFSLTTSTPLSLNHRHILQEVLGKHTDEEAEIHEKILTYLKDTGHQTNNQKKLIVMKLRNDGYEASLCKTSWVCTSGLHKGLFLSLIDQMKKILTLILHEHILNGFCFFVFFGFQVFQFPDGYEYIDVMVVENGRQKRIIVDMEFRSQFELARPTVSYKEMIKNLPFIFVGSEEKLNRIIPLLCSAAKTSLKENGLHVPPWRKPAYMQAKWLSKNCKKVSVSPQDIDLVEDHHHKTEQKGSTTCFPSIFSRGQHQHCL
ncbi:uncharacterized protein LOC111311200 isoform X1 [Durio zibethinus]|uniref:Uncharacterized protein LOC111311200 isoform X1 n=1 Tax=Durio zibethinus TaxID=66656 RepID=A0A6P6AN54_DURZI|nr:uncharacterized protein LOC111311200 isoform X1 [Durio zibethinus]